MQETMRSFASDNNSGVHPLVMAALNRANTDHALGYGDDKWTEEAVAKIKETFTQENMNNLIGDSSKIIYDRWKDCIENSKDERVSIILTDAINIVIFYIIKRMSNEEFESMCEAYKKELNEINNYWFENSVKRMSYYNKKVSILFALGFRMGLEERNRLLIMFEKSCLVREEDLNLIKINWIGQ